MEFFHACLRKSAFAISSSYLFNTSDNSQRSSGFLSCGSFPAILTTCCKVSWPELTMRHALGLQHNANTLIKIRQFYRQRNLPSGDVYLRCLSWAFSISSLALTKVIVSTVVLISFSKEYSTQLAAPTGNESTVSLNVLS